jgi:murein DD-endopeptidase MepM/ murein hydrolase activator NlpD
MDIFCVEGNVVLAIANGTIVNYYPFYEGTNALFIAHDGVVVNYGEVMPGAEEKFNWNLSQKKNLNVQAGQPIALVGRLNMIHFEAYRPNTTKNARWMQDGSAAPADLLNPTKLLLGLAAKAIRVV